MRCPLCSFDSTRVVDSRLSEPGDAVRRRRECAECGGRFTTHERAGAVSLGVLKRDGSREAYDRQKLLGGLMRAATKRPVTVPELEAVADAIEVQVRREGGEMDAERIGEHALRALIGLDRVAAIRFASVYRNFEGLDDFEAELRRLELEPLVVPEQLPIVPAVGGDDPSTVPSDTAGSIASPVASPATGIPGEFDAVRRGHVE